MDPEDRGPARTIKGNYSIKLGGGSYVIFNVPDIGPVSEKLVLDFVKMATHRRVIGYSAPMVEYTPYNPELLSEESQLT